jgi:ABC-2 type transport system ATP-binding protein
MSLDPRGGRAADGPRPDMESATQPEQPQAPQPSSGPPQPSSGPPQASPGAAQASPDAASSDPIVMEEVTRTFGDLRAVDGVSLSVPAGTILGLIGPSGSGKTTAIRTLTGGLEPTSGRVRVLGEDPRQFRRQTRERIGYSPQQFVLYQDLTAAENVHFIGSLFGMLWRKRRRRVTEVLELVGLTDARDRRASRLSGGMQRRLELACALVHEPEVLFLDEPTAGIDPMLRQAVWAELRRLRDQKRTLLVTTQYVGEAEYCDLVALLSAGRLVALATPDELRRQAFGGDVIELETERAFDAGSLSAIEGVTAVRQPGPRNLLVVADDAGEVTPRMQEAIEAQGGEVASSREYRPNFDEVFAELVTRDRREHGEEVPDVDAA